MAQIDEKLTLKNGINVVGGTCSFPAGTLTNAQASSASPFDTDKTVHQYLKCYAQESATTANDQTFVVHVAKNSGTIVDFVAGCVGANVGNSTVDFDLLINGVSALSAAVTVDSGDAARAVVAGTVTTTSYVVDDVIEIDIDATVGTGTLGTGAFCEVTLDESYDS